MTDKEALAYALKDERRVVITERELMQSGWSRPLYIARALRINGIPADVDRTGSVIVKHGRLNVWRQASDARLREPQTWDQVYEWLV